MDVLVTGEVGGVATEMSRRCGDGKQPLEVLQWALREYGEAYLALMKAAHCFRDTGHSADYFRFISIEFVRTVEGLSQVVPPAVRHELAERRGLTREEVNVSAGRDYFNGIASICDMRDNQRASRLVLWAEAIILGIGFYTYIPETEWRPIAAAEVGVYGGIIKLLHTNADMPDYDVGAPTMTTDHVRAMMHFVADHYHLPLEQRRENMLALMGGPTPAKRREHGGTVIITPFIQSTKKRALFGPHGDSPIKKRGYAGDETDLEELYAAHRSGSRSAARRSRSARQPSESRDLPPLLEDASPARPRQSASKAIMPASGAGSSRRSAIKPLMEYKDVRQSKLDDEAYRMDRMRRDAVRIRENMLAWVNTHASRYQQENFVILTIVFSSDHNTQLRAAHRFEAMGKAMRIMTACGEVLPRCPVFDFGVLDADDYYARGRVRAPPRADDENTAIFHSYLYYARQAQYYGAKRYKAAAPIRDLNPNAREVVDHYNSNVAMVHSGLTRAMTDSDFQGGEWIIIGPLTHASAAPRSIVSPATSVAAMLSVDAAAPKSPSKTPPQGQKSTPAPTSTTKKMVISPISTPVAPVAMEVDSSAPPAVGPSPDDILLGPTGTSTPLSEVTEAEARACDADDEDATAPIVKSPKKNSRSKTLRGRGPPVSPCISLYAGDEGELDTSLGKLDITGDKK